MMSSSERARRRGALDQDEFLMGLASAGFRELPTRRGELHAFVHPARPGRRFVMSMEGETYSRAFARLTSEVEEH